MSNQFLGIGKLVGNKFGFIDNVSQSSCKRRWRTDKDGVTFRVTQKPQTGTIRNQCVGRLNDT